jgi:hypothetical protein
MKIADGLLRDHITRTGRLLQANVGLSSTPSSRAAGSRGIDPFAYLKDVFARLPSMTNWQIKDITPKAWARRQCTVPLQDAA